MSSYFTTYPERWEGGELPSKPKRRPRRKALFQCMECGRTFYSAKSAERAAFGDSGCPGCGSSDIDAYIGD